MSFDDPFDSSRTLNRSGCSCGPWIASRSGSSAPEARRIAICTELMPAAASAVLSICSIACSRSHPGAALSNVASKTSRTVPPFCCHATSWVPGGTWLV
jgi:hypothetical protein